MHKKLDISPKMTYHGLVDMADTKNSKARILMPAIVAISFYYSALFTLAIVLGYFASKLFYHFFVKNGKVDCIFIDWKQWKIHLHHWIMGVMVLAIVWVLDYFYLPTLFTGFVIGVIIHDIYDFNDWYKVILKNYTPPTEIA